MLKVELTLICHSGVAVTWCDRAVTWCDRAVSQCDRVVNQCDTAVTELGVLADMGEVLEVVLM